MFQQGSFQLDPNMGPDDVARRRAMLDRMVRGDGPARSVPEGLAKLAAGFMAGSRNRKLDEIEKQGRASADDLMSRIGGGPRPGPMAIGGIPPVQQTSLPSPDQEIANDTMAALGKQPVSGNLPSVDQVSSYIVSKAQELGIDPQTALAVAKSEGLNADPNEAWQSRVVKNGKRERSYGPYQLYIDGGLGNSFMDNTGLDPRDPSTWRQQVDYALSHASQNGWGAWYGAANTGIGDFQGIPGGTAGGTSSATPRSPQSDTSYLYEALNNPWLTQTQRASVLSQISQIERQNDPAYQLDMQYKQAQIDALRNPTPKRTAAMKEYDFAVTQGFEGSFSDYQTAIKKAGASSNTLTVGGEPSNIGTIPQGYAAIPDANEPSGYRMVAIPGGPEDNSDAEGEQDDARDTSSDVVINAATRALGAARDRQVGGLIGGLAAFNPSSENAELTRQVSSLKSIASAEALNAMRRQSPTGGALGNVTEKELKLLSEQAGALDPMSPNFERDLKDYTQALLRTIHGREAGDEIFQSQLEGSFAPRPEKAPAVPKGSEMTQAEWDALWLTLSDEEKAAFQ